MEVETKMANVNNIIVGAANVWVSKKDSTEVAAWPTYALPTFTANTTAATAMDAATGATGWRNVGFTSEGIEVQYSPDYGDIQVDQLLDTAKLFKSAMEVMIATEMSEGTLENIATVFGQPASTLSTTGTGTSKKDTLGLEAGALGAAPTERQLIAVGLAPTASSTASERVYYARRVLSVQQSQFSLARTTPTTFPVTFRLLPDASYAGSEYGKIIDRVLVA